MTLYHQPLDKVLRKRNPQVRPPRVRLQVEFLEERLAPAVSLPDLDLVVINTNSSGTGSLAQAIEDANVSSDRNTIKFNINSSPKINSSPLTILSAALPDIVFPVFIDGTTQPGFKGVPIITLNGGSDGGGSGLTITGGGSTVQGLVINGFGEGSAIVLSGGGRNHIQGNVLGTDPNGSFAGNGGGIFIKDSADNIIGGTSAKLRNVISGNAGSGISIFGKGATGNLIQGNFIGADAAGSLVPNFGNGVDITDAAGSQVVGNVIARNKHNGVFITGSTATGNLIGGNTIAFNGLDGVAIEGGTGNSILSNSIFRNGGLGIDLNDDDKITPPDVGDRDTGANGLQNFPILTAAFTGSVHIDGTFIGGAGAFILQFFASNVPNADAAQGQFLVGTRTITTVAGAASFSFIFPAIVPAGFFITATATDGAGNTSEFARAIVLAPGAPVDDPIDDPNVINALAPDAEAIDADSGADDGLTNLVPFLKGGVSFNLIDAVFLRRGERGASSGGNPIVPFRQDDAEFGTLISGTVFEDFDGDGARSREEPSLRSETVYMDLNGNGFLDDGEPSAVTDRDGNYQFSGVPAGTYSVRVVPRPFVVHTAPKEGGHRVNVSPARRVVTNVDFGAVEVRRRRRPARSSSLLPTEIRPVHSEPITIGLLPGAEEGPARGPAALPVAVAPSNTEPLPTAGLAEPAAATTSQSWGFAGAVLVAWFCGLERAPRSRRDGAETAE